MSDPRALARLWAGGSVFETDAARDQAAFPFVLVAQGPAAGREVGRSTGELPARTPFPAGAGAPLRLPIILDAAATGDGAPKGWAALARGAASAGTALLVSAPQLRARGSVLKAAGVPVFLRVAPGEALAPADAALCSVLAPALASPAGAPAWLAEDALPGFVEAMRAITQYRAPVALFVPPGRAPSASGLEAAASAGLAACCFEGGAGPSSLPLAALFGHAVSARNRVSGLASFVSTDAVTDGVQLACALAVGGGLVATSLPARLALKEESTTDADWKATGDRLGQAMKAMWQDAKRASAAAGARDPRDLTPDNLRALTYDAAALSGAKLAGFDERLPWWSH